MISVYLAIAFASVTIAGFSQILLKKGAMRPHISLIKDYLNPQVMSGYALMFLSVLSTMYVYRGLNYMTIQVVEAFGYVLVPVLSYIFLREKFTRNKIIGIIVIIAGMLIYNM